MSNRFMQNRHFPPTYGTPDIGGEWCGQMHLIKQIRCIWCKSPLDEMQIKAKYCVRCRTYQTRCVKCNVRDAINYQGTSDMCYECRKPKEIEKPKKIEKLEIYNRVPKFLGNLEIYEDEE